MSASEIERLRLFVPCKKRPNKVAVDHEWIENPNDGSFAQAFSFGTIKESRLSEIESALGALVAYCPFDLNSGRNKVLDLVNSLRKQGALAVLVEQSKLGWDIDDWIKLVSSKNHRDLHRAVIVMLTGSNHVQSCGMHAFSLPDARITVEGDLAEGQELLTILNIYQIAEDPVLLTGQTFTPVRDAPKRIVERWPDNIYSSQNACHNPFGIWRVGPPGAQGQPQSELAPVFVPALVTVLTALEQKAGVPLTKEEVERTRDEGTCIAMKYRDAQNLERSRGYSDLEPSLAWEQWQVVRASNSSER